MNDTTFEIIVTGESMWPVLVPGKRYMARRDVEPCVGDIVVARNPKHPSETIVKHISRIAIVSIYDLPTTTYELIGTVSWSSTFIVDRASILGVVII